MKNFLCIYPKNCKAQKLALWALKFTPLVGIVDEALILDLSGTERLHKGDLTLRTRIKLELAGFKIQASIAIAPTIGKAWALAVFASDNFSSLPIDSLRIPPKTAAALREVGINTISDLSKLPIKTLGQRFGAALISRIDQANGAVAESFEVVRPPKIFKAEKIFETPLNHQASVKATLLYLFSQVLKKLQSDYLKTSCFQLCFEGLREKKLKQLDLHTPTFTFNEVASTLEIIIESLKFPENIKKIWVKADLVEKCTHHNGAIFPQEEKTASYAASEILNNFSAKLAEPQLKKLGLSATHLPEKSFYYQNIRSKTKPQAEVLNKLQRPSLLLEMPEEIKAIAMLPDYPPASISWQGRNLKILCASGPEKISGEWWAKPEERNYYKVQDEEGRWLWIYRDLNLRWFVHGLWA